MQLMQTPADIIDDACIYIGWIFAGIPFVFLYNMVSAIMRALGDSKTPLYFLVLTSALNVGLDLYFILVFKMGVLGAAVATDLSQAISGVLSFAYMLRRFEMLKMQPGETKVDKAVCLCLSSMGLPMGLQCSITAIGSVIMQSAVNMLGSTAVAAVTAAGKNPEPAHRSAGKASAPPWRPTRGRTLARRGWGGVRRGVLSANGMVVAYSLVAVVLLHYFDIYIIALFLDTSSELTIVTMAREYMFWNSLFFIPLGMLIVWRYSIQGLGYSSLAMLAGVAEMGCPHGGGACAGSAAGLFRGRTFKPRGLGGGLRDALPGLPLDDAPA